MSALLLLLFACTCQGEAPVELEPEASLADPPPGAPEPGQEPKTKTVRRIVRPPGVDVEAGVQQVVDAGSTQLQACYEQRLAEVPELEGSLDLVVGLEAGAVTEVRVEGSVDDEAMRYCVEQVVRGWSFEPEATVEVQRRYTFRPGPERW